MPIEDKNNTGAYRPIKYINMVAQLSVVFPNPYAWAKIMKMQAMPLTPSRFLSLFILNSPLREVIDNFFVTHIITIINVA